MSQKNTQQFSLVLSGVDENTPNLEDALYEAGCDDALINFSNGTVSIDFDRKADSIENAIISAIHEVEQANIGAAVESVTPEPYVSIADIAKRINASRQRISLYVSGKRGNGNFPRPIFKVDEKSPLWRWSAVLIWLCKHGKLNDEKQSLIQAKCIEDINAILEARNENAYKHRKILYQKLVGN